MVVPGNGDGDDGGDDGGDGDGDGEGLGEGSCRGGSSPGSLPPFHCHLQLHRTGAVERHSKSLKKQSQTTDVKTQPCSKYITIKARLHMRFFMRFRCDFAYKTCHSLPRTGL